MKNLYDAGDIIKIFKELEADINKLWCFAEKCCAKIPVNIGSGVGLFKKLYRDKWEFKTILPGDNVTITEQDNTITINSTGGGGTFDCSDLNSCDTDSLPEGVSNLYYTDARVLSEVTGLNISIFNNDVPFLSTVSVDGITITGDGTPGDPLIASGISPTVYTDNQIVFGDGVTAGGITDANMSFTLNGDTGGEFLTTGTLGLKTSSVSTSQVGSAQVNLTANQIGVASMNLRLSGTTDLFHLTSAVNKGIFYAGAASTGLSGSEQGLGIDILNTTFTLGKPGAAYLNLNTSTSYLDDENGTHSILWGNGTYSLRYAGNTIFDWKNLKMPTLGGSGAGIVAVDNSGNLSWLANTVGTVTNVTATSPLTSSGGTTPDISTSMNTNKLIGRSTIGIGVMEEITLGTGLSFTGTTLNATASVTPAALTKVDDTNVTLTLSGTPLTALLEATTLTLGWTGTLADARIASATNWNTAYTNRITSLTTTGTSGAATLVANTLNIPQYTGGSGTVTSVAALTLGTTGTDLSSTVANSTTTPVITLQVPTASAANRGALSSTDWSTFNSKQSAITTGTTAQYFRGDLSLATFPTIIADDTTILAYQALGSTIKAMAIGLAFDRLNTATTLSDQNEMYVAVYLPTAQTITGVKWYQGTQGNYTANNYNGVGLYSYSGGTMTLVASSTDDGTIWKAAATTVVSKAFSSTYAAAAGIYFVGALWCRSAVVTAPSIYGAVASATLAAGAVDFTNSAKIYSTKSAGTSLPATRLQSATTGTNVQLFFALY